MKVRIKTWDEMKKEFGLYEGMDETETYLNLDTFCWHTELERLIPKDRIIEVKPKNGLGEHYMVGQCYGISDDAIAKYLDKEESDTETSEEQDYVENLEYENRMFEQFLSGLGYTAEQISDIAMTGNTELDTQG